MFELGDSVRIKNGGPEVFTIVEIRSAGPYKIQLGNDGTSVQYKKESELELVAKAQKPNSGSAFVPTRPIMEPEL